MANPEGEEDTIQGLLENDGNLSMDWRDAQSNIDRKLRNVPAQNQVPRTRPPLTATTKITLIKRAKRIADDQHDDVAALLGASEPRGKSEDDKSFDEILDSVVQELNEEQLGPSVSEQLANVVN